MRDESRRWKETASYQQEPWQKQWGIKSKEVTKRRGTKYINTTGNNGKQTWQTIEKGQKPKPKWNITSTESWPYEVFGIKDVLR